MTGFAANTDSARHYYAELGFDTIPLPPNSKQAVIGAWQSRSSNDMWSTTPRDFNVGIRCGGRANLAVIDCDEKEQLGTFENAQAMLTGFGYLPNEYPVVQTDSGIGRHIYITMAEPIQGNYNHLSPEMGAGEFRFGTGAYVVAPPSIVDNPYELIAGYRWVC